MHSRARSALSALVAIAVALVRYLRDTGYGRQYRDEEIEPAVDRAMWWPEYVPYIPG